MSTKTASPIEFFVAAVASQVRTMPLTEARIYLRGLLGLLSPDAPVDALREAYRHIDGADAQLDLLATGQLPLDLGGSR